MNAHFQFCGSADALDTLGIIAHDFMASSEDHNLDEQIHNSYPVSMYFPPSLEYRGSPTNKQPSTTKSQKSAIRPLAPRKGSPRRETHIPRPRNAFMIFRSEYHAQSKITTDVERDHRHISRIVGHLWNNMSEQEKAPYRLMAENEKLEHQQKYPGYRFSPGTRLSRPVKRNVKRNGQSDLARSQKVAEFLEAGLEGRALESALKDIGFDSSPSPEDSSRSASSSPAAGPSTSLPGINEWYTTSRESSATRTFVFRSPLLAPHPGPTASSQAQRLPEHPIMDSLRPDTPTIIPASTHIPQNAFIPPPTPVTFQTQMPEGSAAHGYHFYAPDPYVINHDGHFTYHHPGSLVSQTSSLYQNDAQMQHMQYGSSPGLYTQSSPLDTLGMSPSQHASVSSGFMEAQENMHLHPAFYTTSTQANPDPLLTVDPMQLILNL